MPEPSTPSTATRTVGYWHLCRGTQIDHRSERDLISKIWEAAICTEGQPDCAVAVMLSIDDDEGLNRVYVDSAGGQSDLDTIERTIALLKAVRHALRLSRLHSA